MSQAASPAGESSSRYPIVCGLCSLDRFVAAPGRSRPPRPRGRRSGGLAARRRHVHQVDVQAKGAVGSELGHVGGDDRPPVPALDAVAPVAEPVGDLSEGGGDPPGVPARLRGRAGEPVAGQRRYHQVERVGRIGRVGQRVDHVEKLDHGTRPAVGQEQRDGRPVAGPNVQAVDPLAIDGRDELLVAVQAGLVDPPVVGVKPVADDLPEMVQGHALLPAEAGDLIRKPRPSQTFGQVGQNVRRHIDQERL